jgi:hypothetical protein
MVTIEAGTSTPSSTPQAASQQAIVGKSVSQDTLTKADRLEILYVRDPVAVQSAMLVTKAPAVSPRQPHGRAAPLKIVSRHWHDPNAKKSAAVSASRRNEGRVPEGRVPNKSKNVDRGKPAIDLRPCRRPEGFAGLLRALNLTPGCDT